MEGGGRGIHIKHEDEEKDIDESEEKDTIDDDADENKLSPEQEEEAKLRAKYPMAMRPGGSAFLQKRLQKGQKYFDSGDYNMAKAATKSNKTRVNIDKLQLPQTTGEEIPTPETVPPRKASIQQSKLAAGLT